MGRNSSLVLVQFSDRLDQPLNVVGAAVGLQTDFFQQVEDTNTAFFDGFPAGGQKVGVQIADTGRGEVGAVVAGEQTDLIVQVENVVVDGCSGCGGPCAPRLPEILPDRQPSPWTVARYHYPGRL